MLIDKETNKYCRISLFSDENDEEESLHTTKTVPDPTNYRIKDFLVQGQIPSFETYQSYIVQLLKRHVEKYGTIKEIRLTGHGSKEWLFSQKEGADNERISTKAFLNAIMNMEAELKVKVTNRIVFDGCQTFAHLNNDDIKYYSEYAKRNHTQIVGTTSNTDTIVTMGLHIRAGRYVQFSPDGKIVWDMLDAPYKSQMLKIDSDQSWTDFFINHTPEEGAALKSTHEKQNTIDTKYHKPTRNR